MSYALEVSVGSKAAITAPHKEQKNTNEDVLAEWLELLKQVDLSGPLATLNETTISDNNGGRIEL